MKHNISKKEYKLKDILSHSWDLFKNNFKLILIITLVVYIPLNILISFIPLEGLMALDGYAAFRIHMRIVQLLESFIGVIAFMAIAFAVKTMLNKKAIGYKEAFKQAVARWPSAIWTKIIAGLFLIGLTILLIIPGVIYSIYWTFATLAVVLFDKSGKKALDYSKSVVKGRWWRVLGVMIVLQLLAFIIGLVVTAPFWLMPENVILDLFSNTLIDVVFSFYTVTITVFFINLDKFKFPQKSD